MRLEFLFLTILFIHMLLLPLSYKFRYRFQSHYVLKGSASSTTTL